MSIGIRGVQYEQYVHNMVAASNIPGLQLGQFPSGFSRHDAGDIQALWNGQPFNIEIKTSRRAQMGSSQLIYDRTSGIITPHSNLKNAIDPDDFRLLLQVAEQQRPAVDAYVDRLNECGCHATGFPTRVPNHVRDLLTTEGMSRPINSVVMTDTRNIVKHYNNKGVFYIQVGGAGLFFLGDNPLNLPVPEFSGSAKIELRIKYSGSSAKQSSELSNLRRAEWVVVGRLLTAINSSYTLDDTESIRTLFQF